MKNVKKHPGMYIFAGVHKGRHLLLCMGLLIQSILQVGVAFLSRNVIDAAIYPKGDLIFWGSLLVADLLAIVILHSCLAWLSGSLMDKLTANLRSRILRAAVYSTDVRLQGFHSGQLLSRAMEDVNTLCDGTVNILPNFVGQVTRLAATFAAVVLIAPNVAVVLAVAAVIVGLAIALYRPILKKRHRAVRLADEKVMATMQEDLQQLELIQSLDAQEKTHSRFVLRQKKSLKEKRKRRFLTVSVSSGMNICIQAGAGTLMLWGAVQVSKQLLTYGSLTAMIQLLSLFRGPVLGLPGLWTRLTAMDVAGERLYDLLQLPQEEEQIPVEHVQSVIFENVTFAYTGDEAPVLQNFSATFSLSRWACLTGISGKGKSTIFKLILGLYLPQEGAIWLETDQGRIPCGKNTRHLFAYVPQDFALFSGTVEENLLLVCDADSEKRREALALAKADFLWDMSAGEQTELRENNTGLSKGQLQRIAIARAILMERPILLLDECTSALDADTETAVLQALSRLGKQAIFVTHRPDALVGLEGINTVTMTQ